MELHVKSLQGSYVVSGLEGGTTISELKRMLHQQHEQQVPEPEEQCLVYKQSVLASPDAALQQLGITHGDQLVMLPVRQPVKRPRAQTTPAADTAAIRAAITEEARSRGIEHTLKEERPPIARRGARPADLLGASSEQLLQLLQQAFDGQLPGLQLNISGGGGAAAGAGAGAGAGSAEAEQEPEGEVQISEPPADRIAALTDMGFSEPLARNALLLQRGNVEAALEWLLEHADDPAAAEPIPQERLRQIYGRRRSRPGRAQPLAGLRPEVLLSQLTDMGFDAAAAQSVLSRVGPSLELAVQMLLGGGSAGGAPPPAAAAAAAAAASSEGGGASAAAAAAGVGAAPTSQQAGSQGQPADAAGNHSSSSDTEQAERGAAAAAAAARADTAAAAVAADTDEEEAASEEDEFEEDEFEEGEDDEYEDEDDTFFDDEEALYDLPLTHGPMQLANLGSADIEQLLQGANLQELTLGNQLMMPGGIDTAMAGPQATLLRLLDSPAFLEQVAAGMQVLQEGGEQEQQQQAPGQQQQQQQPEHEQPPPGSGEGSSS